MVRPWHKLMIFTFYGQEFELFFKEDHVGQFVEVQNETISTILWERFLGIVAGTNMFHKQIVVNFEILITA